jgi:molecular chaperone HscC
MSSSPIVAIDLGTTHSLVGYFRDGQPRLIPNALGSYLTPSVVGLDDNGEVLVGQTARDRLVTHPQQTIANVKRLMGTQKKIQLGKSAFRPEEISALVLKSLKRDAEAALGVDVRRAVVTVPAYFRDAQRSATKVAAELAGLEVERIVNEPTAAALAYGLGRAAEEKRILVFDLGGGTFDISVLELFEGVVEVRAAAGDNFLGGNDFTENVVADFIAANPQHEAAFKKDATWLSLLTKKAEQAKRSLADQREVSFEIAVGSDVLSYSLSREKFAEISGKLIARLQDPVDRAIRDARLRADEIDEILLVGGATRLPVIRETVARIFGRLPSVTLPPDEAIALGACVMADMCAHGSGPREYVLTDVAPFTLGIETGYKKNNQTYTDVFSPVIERNTVIPVSREEFFTAVDKGQEFVEVKIYQGENRKASENAFLGKFKIPLPKNTQDFESITVRFSYDLNGILEVEAKNSKGKTESIVIHESPGKMSPDDIKKALQKLSKLKVHPRENELNKAQLTRGDRLYAEFTGDTRNHISMLVSEFESVLAAQDLREIERAREALMQSLDDIEKLLKV